MGKSLTKQDVFEVVDEVVNRVVNNVVPKVVNEAVNKAVSKVVNRIVNKAVDKSSQDILETVNKSFFEIEQKMATKSDLVDLETRMVSKNELKAEFAKFETRMVSKDYLDQKLSDLRGDLVAEIRGTDRKISATVNLLAVKKIFSVEEAAGVLI